MTKKLEGAAMYDKAPEKPRSTFHYSYEYIDTLGSYQALGLVPRNILEQVTQTR